MTEEFTPGVYAQEDAYRRMQNAAVDDNICLIAAAESFRKSQRWRGVSISFRVSGFGEVAGVSFSRVFASRPTVTDTDLKECGYERLLPKSDNPCKEITAGLDVFAEPLKKSHFQEATNAFSILAKATTRVTPEQIMQVIDEHGCAVRGLGGYPILWEKHIVSALVTADHTVSIPGVHDTITEMVQSGHLERFIRGDCDVVRWTGLPLQSPSLTGHDRPERDEAPPKPTLVDKALWEHADKHGRYSENPSTELDKFLVEKDAKILKALGDIPEEPFTKEVPDPPVSRKVCPCVNPNCYGGAWCP